MAGPSVSVGAAIGLVFGFFVLGIVLTAIIFLCFPSLYRRLQSIKMSVQRKWCGCCREQSRMAAVSATVQFSKQQTTSPHTGDAYSEIDENKTRTFQPVKPLSKLNGGGHINPNMFDTKDEYEDLETNNSQFKRFSNHTYCIVEPGTKTRLQVKMVDTSQDKISSDDSHIYFILEPGSDKVLPVFQNTTKGKTEVEINKDHTYFVLESAEHEADGQAAIPYAVNDISEPMYYVLEKQ